MVDLAQENQLISEETNEDGVDHDELQLIDAPTQIEESKEEKLTKKIGMAMQIGDLTKEQPGKS